MWQLFRLFYFVSISISFIHTQVLYQCNFDGENENCFTTTILMITVVGVVSTLVPNGALSDVSSITKPTANGEMCILPYKVLSTYTWDMYFCNKGFCPTASSPNSTCTTGRFGTIPLANSNKREFQLKTESGGINGKDQQCLTYYYYMGNVSQKIIEIRKEEVSGESVIIDSVTSSPFNGWIVRRVSFNAEALGYKIYFEVQRTSTTGAPNVGLDEISIHQGSCGDEPITDTPATTPVPITTTVTTTIITTTTISTTVATTTTTTLTITTPIPTTSTTTTTTTTTIPSTTTTPTTTTPTTTTSTIPTDPPSTTTTTVTTTTTPTDPPSTTTTTTTTTTTSTPTDPPSTTTTTTTTTVSTPTDPPSTTTTATTISTATDPPSTTTTTITVSTPTNPPSTMTTTKTTQVIYQCNFDGETENCFDSTPLIAVAASVNVAGPVAPSAALSDVSSIIKPTANGEMCILPFKVGTYIWDMYFCNRGYCPTASNPNSTCTTGRFGNVALNNNQTRKFQLKTETGGVNGKDQQCLIYYYYYMPVAGDKIISIRKEEVNGESVIIDSATDSPFNRWIVRRVSFTTESPGYKIYFEVQRTNGFQIANVGLDEISIHQGSCRDEPITVTPATTPIPITTTITTGATTTTPTNPPTTTTTTTTTASTNLPSTTTTTITTTTTTTPTDPPTTTTSTITTTTPIDTLSTTATITLISVQSTALTQSTTATTTTTSVR
ncbi:unnamed protein product [Adineta steineri]|uniref:MAM domain-containing protein n=1 Tax=Adineta steineri TaxID=433720 RepID=A0A815BBN5_9BILA|nr:unnamed protein product [Adineta steineri]